MQFGLFSFVDWTEDAKTGQKISATKRIEHLIEEAVYAEQVGLDVYGIGEHHRDEYLASAPEVLLAAIAAKTDKILLNSSVTVLSSDDPVRVFQRFAELDLISKGRAEIIAGRGSFIESFPLFGYELTDYEELFSEKLELLLEINDKEKVDWVGNHRQSIDNLGVYPRPHQDKLPIWRATGGSPSSAVSIARLGLPLALAIIGGYPKYFKETIDTYKKVYKQSGHDEDNMKISINSHGYISKLSKDAIDTYWPYYEKAMNKIGKERGWSQATRDSFEAACSPTGALVVGDPEEIADKIVYEHELFGMTRFSLQIGISTMPHEKVMKAIELFGKKVKPLVEEKIRINQ